LRKIYEVWLPIKIEVVKQKEALENNLPIEINRVESFCDEIFKKKEEDQYDIDDYCHYLDIALSFNRILSNPFFYGSKKEKDILRLKDDFLTIVFSNKITDLYEKQRNIDKNKQV